MRLLKTSSVEPDFFSTLEYFSDDKTIPEYAILSHTWEEGGEVLFADMQNGIASSKAGYRKLRYSCKQAIADGYDYVWIDTCCIDKGSSAELSEAINSMFSWYQKAEKCYVYLADVSSKEIQQSKWFTRGWTLQELIAPHTVIFYSTDWIQIGTKWTLHNDLAEKTGIDVGILTGERALESASVARRMSWACDRKTTRTEDEAYCLMGLFDVNMPMLYGEGKKAFIRLQEEIMKNSDDQSIFAWKESAADDDCHYGLLAKSPKNFETSGNIFPYRDWERSAPFSVSNKGLRIEFHLTPYDGLYVAALDCPAPPNYDGHLGIFLKRLTTGDRQFARVKAREFGRLQERGTSETVHVRQSPAAPTSQDIYPMHVFQLRKGPIYNPGSGYRPIQSACPAGQGKQPKGLAQFASHRRWASDRIQTTFKITKRAGQLAGAILFERHDGEKLVIALGSMADFTVGFDAVAFSDVGNWDLLQKEFNPRPVNINMGLKDHQVRIHTDQQIHEGTKYYMVDIVIEAIYHSLNPIDLILDFVPALQNDPNERPHNARIAPSRGFGKLKSALKFS